LFSTRYFSSRSEADSIYQRVEDNAFHLRLSGAIDSAATNSRSQWVIFEAAFMTSACTTGIMSAM
jgi:hypothetical protein